MAKKAKTKVKSAGWGPWPAILGVALAALFGFMIWQYSQIPKDSTSRSNTSAPAAPPAETESFRDEGRDHTSPPERVTYQTDPPTSGTHYGTWVRAGLYTEPRPAEELVHNLEHGNVVIWYDPEQTSPEVQASLKDLTQRFPGTWDGVVAVPRTDAEHPVILTAWTQMLRLKEWDQAKAEAFVDAFRGRGPENPVR